MDPMAPRVHRRGRHVKRHLGQIQPRQHDDTGKRSRHDRAVPSRSRALGHPALPHRHSPSSRYAMQEADRKKSLLAEMARVNPRERQSC